MSLPACVYSVVAEVRTRKREIGKREPANGKPPNGRNGEVALRRAGEVSRADETWTGIRAARAKRAQSQYFRSRIHVSVTHTTCTDSGHTRKGHAITSWALPTRSSHSWSRSQSQSQTTTNGRGEHTSLPFKLLTRDLRSTYVHRHTASASRQPRTSHAHALH